MCSEVKTTVSATAMAIESNASKNVPVPRMQAIRRCSREKGRRSSLATISSAARRASDASEPAPTDTPTVAICCPPPSAAEDGPHDTSRFGRRVLSILLGCLKVHPMWQPYRGGVVETPNAPSGEVLRWTELFFELSEAGADLARLGFLRWLVENGRNPEWLSDSPRVGLGRAEAYRRHRRRRNLGAASSTLRP